MPELDMGKAEAFCERMVENGGICFGESCENCPGSSNYNDNTGCDLNGWRNFGSVSSKSISFVESCKEWLNNNAKRESTVLEFEGMSYEEAQTLQPGDRVKVLMKWPDRSYCPRSGMRWDIPWLREMDDFIGGTFEVVRIKVRDGVSLASHDATYLFPWFAIKLVESAPKKITMAAAVALCEEKLGCRVEIVKESEAE